MSGLSNCPACALGVSRWIDDNMRAQVEEEGVTFRSPTDGSMMLLTPEKRFDV